MLQSWARMLAKRRALREAVAAAIVVQTVGRRCTARNRFRAVKAAIVLQAAGRRFIARKRYDVLRATLRLQAAARRIIATRRLSHCKPARVASLRRRAFNGSSTPSPRSRPDSAVDRYVNATPRSGQAP